MYNYTCTIHASVYQKLDCGVGTQANRCADFAGILECKTHTATAQHLAGMQAARTHSFINQQLPNRIKVIVNEGDTLREGNGAITMQSCTQCAMSYTIECEQVNTACKLQGYN